MRRPAFQSPESVFGTRTGPFDARFDDQVLGRRQSQVPSRCRDRDGACRVAAPAFRFLPVELIVAGCGQKHCMRIPGLQRDKFPKGAPVLGARANLGRDAAR